MVFISRVVFAVETLNGDERIANLLSPTILQDTTYFPNSSHERLVGGQLYQIIATWAARMLLQTHTSTIPHADVVPAEHHQAMQLIRGNGPRVRSRPATTRALNSNRTRTLAVLPPTFPDTGYDADSHTLYAAVAVSPALIWRTYAWHINSPAPQALGYILTKLRNARPDAFVADPLLEGILTCDNIVILARSEEELIRAVERMHEQLYIHRMRAGRSA
ncbi:unnamed protein product [Peniophora sp. CBMAI 1063]|nr:unnamed protein product [Peniophora sp. CBMAI 1063]